MATLTCRWLTTIIKCMSKAITSRGTGSPDYLLSPITKIQKIRSDKDRHFTDALTKNSSEQENVTGLVSNKIVIKGVTLISTQSLHFLLEFYSKDTFTDPDLNEDNFVGAVELDMPTLSLSTDLR